jgi:hypothetical protein
MVSGDAVLEELSREGEHVLRFRFEPCSRFVCFVGSHRCGISWDQERVEEG